MLNYEENTDDSVIFAENSDDKLANSKLKLNDSDLSQLVSAKKHTHSVFTF